MNRPRERLLAAADELLGSRPWGKVSLGAVATHAGVSRQTLYNEFGGRREFAQAFVLREADKLLEGPEDAITRAAANPRVAIARALETFLEAAVDNHLLRAMREDEDGGLLALVTTRGDVLRAATERLHAHVRGTWPGVDEAATRKLMDVVVRLGISHSNLPTAPPARTAAEIVEVIGPQIDALFAALPRMSPRAA